MALKLLLIAVASLVWSTVSLAQPLYESGSVEAYRQRVRIQNQAIDQQIAARERLEKWRDSSKLKLPTFGGDPTNPHQRDDCLKLAKLSEGSVGYLDCEIFEVFEIVGPNDLYLVVTNPDKPPICLKGFSTKGLASEQKVVVLGLVEVKGTTSYIDTEGGNVTIRNIHFVSQDREAEIERDRAAQAELERQLEEERLYRTWTSTDGKHKVEAKFVKFQKGKVYLENRSGKVIVLSPNKLSKEDRDYYRTFVKSLNDPQHKLLKALTPE